MGNFQSVGRFGARHFGRYLIATSGVVTINSTAVNAVAMPVLSGGVTPNGGGFIIRQVTVTNQTSQNTALANVQICTSSDGATANSVTANSVLSTLTGINTWQDLVPTSAANTTIYNVSVLYANVITNVANSNVIFSVYGQVVSY